MKDIPKYGTTAWKVYQYEQAHIARPGRNYKYLSGNEIEILEEKGYIKYEHKVTFPSVGQDIVRQLRLEGNYATMLLAACSIKGCPEVYIYYKPKKLKE